MVHPQVSVIIVSYNTSELLSRCLRSLQSDPDHPRREVIVVDNCSADDSVAMLSRQFPDVTVLALSQNEGFARANNRGSQIATGRYLLFLNADTEVPPGVISALADFLESTADADIVGPQMEYPDGRFQDSKRSFPGPLMTLLEYSGLERLLPRWRPFGLPRLTHLDPDGVHRVDYVAGACLMISRERFDRLGGWCEEYFFYAEDADLCARALQNGGHTYYYGKRRIMHVAGASSAQVGVRATIEAHRSVFLFILRHRGPWAFWLTRLITIAGVSLRGLMLAILLPLAALPGKATPVIRRLRNYRRVLALCLSPRPLPTGRFIE